MKGARNGLVFLVSILTHNAVVAQESGGEIEELIVTAQKRDQLLRQIPIAATVISQEQLRIRGINGLDTLSNGEVPSLRIIPFGNSPSTKVVTIRGNGPLDIAQVTLEPSVAIYYDEIYLGRGHGLSTEYADLAQVEVLRGPQGTMFGRNAIGGAVKLVSKKPSGEFSFRQRLGFGRYNELRSVTLVNLPEFSGVSAKLEYSHAERDGWVKNLNSAESDYNAYDKDGGRLSLHWRISDPLSLDYSYDNQDVEVTQNYIQLYRDGFGAIGPEPERQTHTRRPVLLDPTVNKQEIHGLTLAWSPSDNLTLKSISSYRDMDEVTNNNFDGVLYFNGLIARSFIDQQQVSQEFQLLGAHGAMEWTAGLYYYKEQADEILLNLFTRDISGCITGTPNAPIEVTNIYNEGCGAAGREFVALPRDISADTESRAIYANLSWSPASNQALTFNAGLRYTEDSKDAERSQYVLHSYKADSDFLSHSLSAQYDLSENLMAYISWNTGYKAGGVNSRSTGFEGFDEEENSTYEIGLKAELFDDKASIYSAFFISETDGRQITVSDPDNPGVTAQVNADEQVDINGFETEINWRPNGNWLFGASYTYLDSNSVLHSNPLSNGAMELLAITQSPEHAGALWSDYTFLLTSDIEVTAHIDATATDRFAFVASGEQLQRGYELFNARIKVALPWFAKRLEFDLWVDNIFDEEYLVFTRSQGANAEIINQVFGDPRTYGLSITLEL